jgi:hypothetical protein
MVTATRRATRRATRYVLTIRRRHEQRTIAKYRLQKVLSTYDTDLSVTSVSIRRVKDARSL